MRVSFLIVSRNLALSLAFILTNFTSTSQNQSTDSIYLEMGKSRNDTNKVNSLIELSKSICRSSPDEAINFGNEARELAQRLHFLNGEANALKYIGMANYFQGNYLETIQFWIEAKGKYAESDDRLGVANMLNNIGAIYFSEGDDTKALENYLESLRISEEIGIDTLRIATALVNIGAVYSQKKATYDKAVEYYLKALPLSELLGDHDAIGTTCVNLGGIYLERENVDSALFYFNRSLVAYRKSSVGNVPFALYNMGKAYTKMGDYPKAIRYQEEAFELAKQNNAKLEMAQSLVGLGDAYKQQGNIKLAISAYLQGESISTEIGATYEQKSAYEGLASSYSDIYDFHHAYKYQELLTGIKDTIYNAENDKKLQSIQFAFDIEKKEGEIEILTKDKELQDLEMERQKVVRNALVGGLFLILIIAFILVRSIRNKIKIGRAHV